MVPMRSRREGAVNIQVLWVLVGLAGCQWPRSAGGDGDTDTDTETDTAVVPCEDRPLRIDQLEFTAPESFVNVIMECVFQCQMDQFRMNWIIEVSPPACSYRTGGALP